MARQANIFEKHATIHYVCFPLSGMYSLVGDTSDGKTAEVATVGREGMLGLPVFLGTHRIPLRAFTQIPGDVLRMEADDFRAFTADMNGSLARLLYAYTQALLNHLAQHAACTTVHSVRIRCARWLLMCHDRVGMNEFPLTHEFLAQMLGVRRASVTLIAASLHQQELIAYRRGIVKILDRKGLEAAACEHYTLTRDEYDRLLSFR
jgi:CRP-like cAMP-binding protein